MPDSIPQVEHSHEVQEILGHVPHWLIRWGIGLLFSIFALIISGSYFFKYPINVISEVVITTVNSPAPLTASKSGRIARWLAKDGQSVEANDAIALMDSEVSFENLTMLDSLISAKSEHHPLPYLNALSIQYQLGELQPLLRQWVSSLSAFESFLANPNFNQNYKLIENRIQNQSAFYEQMVIHRSLKRQEFELAQNEYKRDSTLYRLNKYGISKSEFETSQKKYLSQQSEYLLYEASFYDHELNILKSQQELMQLNTRHTEEISRLINQKNQSRITLEIAIDQWKKVHLIKTPVDGKLTLTKYWSENQITTSGAVLATVVPPEKTEIICRALVNSAGIGKIKIGQKVNIKLSGFPSLEYGTLQGKVNSVSLVPEEGGYTVEIKLAKGMTSNYQERLKFIQQMDGIAEIITEEKRLLYKLLAL